MKKVLFSLIFVLCSICFCSCTVETTTFNAGQQDGGYYLNDQTTSMEMREYVITFGRKSNNNTTFTAGDYNDNANTGEVRYHYVTEGQGLKEIARMYDCDFEALLQYNNLYEDSIIYADQQLIIPPARNNQVVGNNGYNNNGNSYNNGNNSWDGNLIRREDAIPKPEPGYYAGVTYTTDYNSLLNIEHSCNDLNGTIVPAYSKFSWFRDVGPCTEGYEEALVLDDTYVPTAENPNPTAKGGGVCVTSSCLRNAAEAVVGSANILEAHNHTKNGVPIDMSYAPIGHQASLNYRGMDFRFYNPYPYTLRIEAYFEWETQTCYVSVIPE